MGKLLTTVGGILGGLAALLIGLNQLSKAWQGFDMFHPSRTPAQVAAASAGAKRAEMHPADPVAPTPTQPAVHGPDPGPLTNADRKQRHRAL